MLEFIAGIGAAFVSLFGVGTLTYTATPLASQPASAIVAQATPEPTEAQTETPEKILNPPPSTAPAAVQYITQPVIVREVLPQNAVTREELDTSLAALRSDLLFVVANSLPKAYTFTYPAATAPVSTVTFAHSQRIDQLGNVTITNATVSGVTGLTNADIPDDITASNYLPLSGGSLTFASSTLFSVFNGAYFGASATSSFDSAGALTLATPLLVSSGGTGANTFGQGWVYSSGGTGALAASTSPTVAYLTATSTTQASTFPYASTTALTASGTGYFGLGAFTSTTGTTTIASGQGFTIGGSQFVLQQGSGKVGIGTVSPTYLLSIESGTSGFTTGWNRTGGATAGLYADFSKAGVGTISTHDLVFFTGSAAPQVTLQISTGNLGIGTTTPWRKLSVTGTVGFDGLTGSTGAGSLCLTANREVVYNSASDACLPSLRETKHDISSLSIDALEMVDALDPVSFVYNDGDGRVRYGFIAEDTAAVDPHLVTYSESGTLSGIDDRSIISIVVKAIKELRAKVDALVATVAGFADRITTKELCVEDVCVTRDQFLRIVQNTDQSLAPSEVEEDAPDTEAPVITINGNNPATLSVGDTYADLGATVTDNVDLNLGLHVFVDSTPMDQAVLDTSEPNEWHIHYVATDNAGNTATSTRTVIVEAPSIVPSDAPVEEPEGEVTEELGPEEEPIAS